jgi:serine protease Do
VRVQRVTDEIAEVLGLEKATGALVASVNDEGPAKESGLEAGDIILEINDQTIKETKALPRIIAEYDVGTKVEVVYWRDNKKHRTTVTIGELEKAEEEGLITPKPSSSEESGVNVEMMGFTLKTLNNALRSKYSISTNTEGVLIIDIKPLSEAAQKGLQIGDVIMEINQQPVSKDKEVSDIIDKAKANGRKSVLLLVNNKGNTRFIALRIKYDDK